MEIKTAEEIYEELYGSKMIGATGALNLAFKEMCCKVAKIYANQKLDEAADKARMKEYTSEELNKDNSLYNTAVENGMGDVFALDKQSILDIKQLIK